jgi:peptidoglycan/LPS O-acetylase OafA/YrhL
VTNTERFESLDAWRGVCALLVAFYHYIYALPSGLRDVGFLHNSYLFVDFFFVLSGFVIFHTYRDRIDNTTGAAVFALRRFGRVWPAHMAVLAGFVILLLIVAALPHPNYLNFTADYGAFSGRAFLFQIVLLNAMGFQGGTTWNGPAWSIGAEFYTYLMFACVILLWRRRLVTVSIALSFLALTIILWRAPDYMNSTWDYGLIRSAAGFFIGGVAYHIHERSRAVPLKFATIVEIVGLAVVVLFVSNAGDSPDAVSVRSLAAPVVFAAAVLIFARERGYVSLILKLAPFRGIGRYSYSIYITHELVLILIVYLTWFTGVQESSVPPQQLGMFQSWPTGILPLVFFAVLLLVSATSYGFIEVRARNYFNDLATRLQERVPARTGQA